MNAAVPTANASAASNTHKPLSASALHRRLICTAEYQATKDLPEKPSSPAALEGSACHCVCYQHASGRTITPTHIKQLMFDAETDDLVPLDEQAAASSPDRFHALDMDMLETARDWQSRLIEITTGEPDAQVWLEKRVRYSQLYPEQPDLVEGTADAIVYLPRAGRVHVVDLKYGYGKTNATEQLKAYGLGGLNLVEAETGDFSIDHVRVEVFQPRINHYPVTDYTRAELESWAAWGHERAREVFSDSPVFRPSESVCQWCALSGQCDAESKYLLTQLKSEFDEITEALPDLSDKDRQAQEALDDHLKALDPDQSAASLQTLLRMAPHLKRWIDAVQKHATGLAQVGQLPGYKIVTGRGSRAWSDDPADRDKLKAALRSLGLKAEQYQPRALVSPHKIEKLVGAKKARQKLGRFIVSSEGAPKLVESDDEREGVDHTKDFD